MLHIFEQNKEFSYMWRGCMEIFSISGFCGKIIFLKSIDHWSIDSWAKIWSNWWERKISDNKICNFGGGIIFLIQ